LARSVRIRKSAGSADLMRVSRTFLNNPQP
jgi:hypothetical protein